MTTDSDSASDDSHSVNMARRIDAACDQFERDWKVVVNSGGQPPRLEDYIFMTETPGECRLLLPELLAVEIHYRRLAGLPLSPADYLDRFPSYTNIIEKAFGMHSGDHPRRGKEAGCSEESPAAVRAVDATPSETSVDGGRTGSWFADEVIPPAIQAQDAQERPDVPGYDVLGVLGQGGMGIVYLARQHGLDRTVALKMIRPGGRGTRAALDRFRDEARAVARLQHPNVVQVFQFGEHQGSPFFALEFVAGGSLADALRGTTPGPAEAAWLVEAIARGVDHAHRVGIVHRDLKPANVLLQFPTDAGAGDVREGYRLRSTVPKVADFGLMKWLDAADARTGPGEILGTACYLAPEQARGDSASAGPTADVYALGAILYELLTGRPPFRGDTISDTLRQVLTMPPTPPSALRDVPKQLENICLRCLTKDPALRYPSAAALADELAGFLAAAPGPASAGSGSPTDGLDDAGTSPAQPRSFVNLLLDPQSIQWLLVFGGVSMVTGLIILLYVKRFFNPPILATILAATNVSVLLSGWAVMERTRYQTAGRALTLLACLVMPLNLWYYCSHDLLTMEHQGHLWVAALVISGLYLASALVLQDELFVHVFVAGITLTGLLMLADLKPSPQRFWEVRLPSITLVALGLLSLHTERFFPNRDGPFSRNRFGTAFLTSGHAVLAGGLLLLLGAHIAGDWLYDPFFKPIYEGFGKTRPDVVTTEEGRILSLTLITVGMYAAVYSHLLVRRLVVFVFESAVLFVWGQFLALELLGVALTTDVVLVVLSLAALLVNVLDRGFWRVRRSPPLMLFGPVLGLLMFGIGVTHFGNAVRFGPWFSGTEPLNFPGLVPATAELARVAAILPEPLRLAKGVPAWPALIPLVLSGVLNGLSASLQSDRRVLTTASLFAVSGAGLNAVLILLRVWSWRGWDVVTLVVTVLPLAYVFVALAVRRGPVARPLLSVAHLTLFFLIVVSGHVLVHGFAVTVRPLGEIEPARQLTLVLFCLETGIVYLVMVAGSGHPGWLLPGLLAMSGSLWQLLHYLALDGDFYTVAYAVAGFILMCMSHLRGLWTADTPETSERLAKSVSFAGHALLSLALTAAVFIGSSRLMEVARGAGRLETTGAAAASGAGLAAAGSAATGSAGLPGVGSAAVLAAVTVAAQDLATARMTTVQPSFLLLCGMIGVVSLIAAATSRGPDWRRWYAFHSVAQVIMFVVAVSILAELRPWQKIELVSFCLGVLFLIAGHLGWLAEDEAESRLVTCCLVTGSLLVGLPLPITTVADRGWEIGRNLYLFHEIAFLATTVVLLLSGVICKIKSTTLMGVYLFVAYLGSLFLFVHWDRLSTVANVLLAVGGGLFALGLALSVFRDRIRELPDQARRGVGIFQVFRWR